MSLVTLAMACSQHGERVFAADGARATCRLRTGGQPLDATLSEIARSCDVHLVYLSKLLVGKTAPALDGSYNVETALRQVLKGTGLAFHWIGADTIAVQPGVAVAKTDGETKDRATRRKAPRQPPRSVDIGDDLPEVIIRNTVEGLVATRTETPLRDIPQTMSVVSSEQMRQQNNTSLADVLQDAVGITATQYDSANQVFYSRGFQVTTYHLDGGSSLNLISYEPNFAAGPLFMTPDISEFDHIEVLRGADALFGAGGNPGATVNLVRKRPLKSLEATFSATAGSWNNYRAEGDITGPLAGDGALRGRLDTVYSYRNYFFDRASLARKNVFGALEYDVTSSAVITLGGSYATEYARPFYGGLPVFPDGSNPQLPRSTSFTFDWEHIHPQMREGYVRFAQQLNSAWRLKVNATALNGTTEYDLGKFETAVDPATRGLLNPASALFTVGPAWERQLSAEATVTGSAQWLGMKEEMAFGADFMHAYGYQTTVSLPAFGSPVPDVYAYDPAGRGDPRSVNAGFNFPTRSHSNAVQSGYFGSLRVERRPWSLILGLRVSNDRGMVGSTVIYLGQELQLSQPARFSNIGKVTPYIGTMYALDEHLSVYASYADIYLPNAGYRGASGAPLHPADGVNIEAGLKGAWYDGAVTGTIALYRVVQRGLASFDTGASLPGGGCCYLPGGRITAKGVDIEVSGSPAPGWMLSSGYTFNNNLSLIPYKFYGQETSETPRHLFKAWTSWDLPGHLSNWSVGGTLEARSSFFDGGIFCNLDATGRCPGGFQHFRDVQRSFVIVSPRVGYQIDRHWRVALTVANVFDRVYFQTIGGPPEGNWYGEPRNFLVRVDARL